MLSQLENIGQTKLVPLEFPIRSFLAKLGEISQQGGNILLLASGDPLFFGLASTLSEMGASWPIKIIPSVSSLQLACSKIGLPWANISIFSLHGRNDMSPLMRILTSGKNFCLLSGNEPGPDYVARFLLDRGLDNYEVHTFQNLGSVEEQIHRYSLKNCAMQRFSSVCLSIFIRHKEKKQFPYSKYNLLGNYSTPELRRGIILELLQIKPEDTVWDVGAGSGLLACRMAETATAGTVWTIEEKSARALDIQYNRRILACPNMKVVWGHAPEILGRLPRPSKIFIGGGLSSPDAYSLLDVCADKLLSGGNMVICCILLENLQKCLNHKWNDNMQTSFYQSQLSKGEPLGQGMRFVAENPVFLFKIHKGE